MHDPATSEDIIEKVEQVLDDYGFAYLLMVLKIWLTDIMVLRLSFKN